jgi:hypothetical protein
MIRCLLSTTAAALILVMQASTANAASIVTEWFDQAMPYVRIPRDGERSFHAMLSAHSTGS